MKAILMSIKHKWCEMIFRGEKTVEVRKNKPNEELPIKVYVYESIGQGEGAGAVVGEFVCDEVDEYTFSNYEARYRIKDVDLTRTCLNHPELIGYGGGDTLYGWHITKPKLYDRPKMLVAFSKYGYQRIDCVENGCGNEQCRYCDPAEVIAGLYKPPICRKDNCVVTRSPRSWMYVEEIEE